MGGDNNNSEPSTAPFPDFSKLKNVQDILDDNRHMLKQIKSNHTSQKPEELAKNFAMIQDVNENIEKVMQMYAQIGEDYSAFMAQNRGEDANNDPGPGSDDADQPPANPE